MKLMSLLLSLAFLATFAAAPAFATDVNSAEAQVAPVVVEEDGALDELDPWDPNIEQLLEQYDLQYNMRDDQELSISEMINSMTTFVRSGCVRAECKVWAQVVKSTQRMYLHVDGVVTAEWLVSTGTSGHGTPNFDTNPNGRIYDKYTSKTYPGGDYNGLGNMPYAVFISGGFAIHGTGKSNWSKLGTRASHGCVRVHPDNALHFNRLVRDAGIRNVWITIQD